MHIHACLAPTAPIMHGPYQSTRSARVPPTSPYQFASSRSCLQIYVVSVHDLSTTLKLVVYYPLTFGQIHFKYALKTTLGRQTWLCQCVCANKSWTVSSTNHSVLKFGFRWTHAVVYLHRMQTSCRCTVVTQPCTHAQPANLFEIVPATAHFNYLYTIHILTHTNLRAPASTRMHSRWLCAYIRTDLLYSCWLWCGPSGPG